MDRQQGKKKIVYLGPLKALCQERFNDWVKKFQDLNVKCIELTGDSELSAIQELEKTDIIVTTPGIHYNII
jgi:ATP-dependent DNA helicase HFM1/MER3